jgi:hypothetical protein
MTFNTKQLLKTDKYLKRKDGEMIKFNFNLTRMNLPILITKLKELDFSKVWKVQVTERKPIRNLSQNDLYWTLLEGLSDHLGYTKDELHELMKYKYLKYAKEIAGQPVVVVPSTSDLDTAQFAELIENVLRFANEYGCSFQDGLPQYETH